MDSNEYLQSLPEEAIKELLQLANDAKTTSYFAVGAVTFLIYDHLLSFGPEIQFIWMRPKSLASYIYIWNRYLTLAITCISTSVLVREVKTDQVCQIYTLVQGVASTLIVATVDIILLLRVWILFRKSRMLLNILLPSIFIEIATMFTIAIVTILESSHYVHSGPLIKGCYSLTVPTIFAFYPVPSFVVTFIMFVMTLYNCKSRHGVTLTSRNRMPLVSLFLRDGIFWFLGIVAVNPPQILMFAFARRSLIELLLMYVALWYTNEYGRLKLVNTCSPSIVVYSIIGSRVLLNIMEAMNVEVVHLSVP
ncbi:hypothetical protein C8J57DRAFT_1721520 [Mycena rebaudengoi]|nr:hypothetical protein C8J57DRAFT_1721520 [Mycena rebaudengoi]